MSRILLFGLAPLPTDDAPRLYGPGIRTWQFAKPLLAAGHEVTLVTMRIHGTWEGDEPPTEKRVDGRLTHWALDESAWRDSSFILKVHDDARPDAIVGATIHGAWKAARLRSPKPFWADVFGDVLAEAQAAAKVHDNDHYIIHFWEMLQPVLDSADVFSSVSERQLWSLVGALAVRGRLNKHSHAHSFAHVIPCGVDADEPAVGPPVFRGVDVPTGDFVVLWSGGYHTWTDVDTLFAALESAMERNPKIRFVSTGGAIDGHDERTYPRFLEKIAASRHKARYHMRGWVPMADVAAYQRESDVGIHIDQPIYERMLGSENRVLGWMRAGLPALVSEVSELSVLLREQNLARTYPPRNPGALAAAILELAADPEARRTYAERARAYALANFTFETTARPLVEWAKNPECSPDKGKRIPLERLGPGPYPGNVAQRIVHRIRTDGFGNTAKKVFRRAMRKKR